MPEILLQKPGHRAVEYLRGGFVRQHAGAGRLEGDDAHRRVRNDGPVEVERLLHLLLHQLASGDVARNAHDADDLPGAVEPRHFRAGHPRDVPGPSTLPALPCQSSAGRCG